MKCLARSFGSVAAFVVMLVSLSANHDILCHVFV
jgi:hypothetical protein